MNKEKKKIILYFYVGSSTFVQKDIDILSSRYEVRTFNFRVRSKWKIPFVFIWQKIFLLRNMWVADMMVIQFAGYHSFLPALYSKAFGEPSLIIAGGVDTVSMPSIRYGNFYKTFLGLFTRWSYLLCTHISPKHESLWYCEYNYQSQDYELQGIKFFIPRLKKPHTVIHNGFDSNLFCRTKEKKKNSFLTVAGGLHYHFQKTLKGVDLVLELAHHFPECEFTIAGVGKGVSLPVKTKNVTLLPEMPNEKLVDVFSEHQFYFQLSMAEGFPNALCEAMLCECVPIGSNVFSIPEIISDTGFILPKRNTIMLIQLIDEALKSDTASLGKNARKRITENYSLEKRKTNLITLAKEMLGE